MKTPMQTHPIKRAGFSSAEALVSLCIGAFAVAAGLTVNSHELKLVKSTREASAATGLLEERVEQLRSANWRQMTDAEYLADSYFASVPKSAAVFHDYTEKIKVSAWPDETAATPLLIEKKVKSDPVVLLSGSGLAEQRLAKLDMQISWLGKDSRTRVREFTTMISNGGISRVNLPAMGTFGGATDTDTTPTSTPAPTATPTATPTPTPTPAPGNNGNGNGRGNVAGKSGKA